VIESVPMHSLSELSTERAALTGTGKKIASPEAWFDPSLTLARTQYAAIVSNTGNRKPLTYAVIASQCNAQQPPTAHSKLEQVSGSSPLVGSLYSA
jgi:hypothetical protein